MSRTGRPDFDAMVKISSVPSDEPIFLLRAQDPNAAPAVRAWAAIARAQGVPSAVIEQALRQADAMDKWRPKKRPSADHLSDGDRRRLEYEHDRRAWAANADPPTEAILLAERRGFAAARSIVRALMDAAAVGLEAVDAMLAGDNAADVVELARLRERVIRSAMARGAQFHD